MPHRRNMDFAILCPIPEEWESICRILNSVRTPPDKSLPTKLGCVAGLRVVCVNSGKGEGATAACLQSVLLEWRPRWVLLVGIAGGFPEAGIHKGDVIIARYIYNFDFGKLTCGKFFRRPDYDFPADRRLLAYAELVMRAEGDPWKRFITAQRPDEQNVLATRAHDGYIASSSKVVDDPDIEFFKAVKNTIPEVHGVEMEASGAGAAIALEKSRRPVGFLMIRGISDEPLHNLEPNLGTKERSRWKLYAADVASAFVHELIGAISESLGRADFQFDRGIGQPLDPVSPEQIVQNMRKELTPFSKKKKAEKGKVVGPFIAVLHGEKFPASYLNSLLNMLNEASIRWMCPSIEHQIYSYADNINNCVQSCTHILFLARSAKELTSGWAAYANSICIEKQRSWIPLIANLQTHLYRNP